MQTNHDSLFDERRAAQSAAFLLFKAGGSLPLIKVVKLIYLAERLSFQRYGVPLTGDRLVSMDHGPVLSRVYDHMNGAVKSCPGGWETWIADRSGHVIALRDPGAIRSPEEDLLRLSDSDLEVLSEVWEQFGSWERWDLVQYTHDKLPEWEDPHGSSKPISYESLFSALGYNSDQVSHLKERIDEQQRISAAFSS
ncbi:Panacea domain-containing protein [Achromobacter xylosoxidans]